MGNKRKRIYKEASKSKVVPFTERTVLRRNKKRMEKLKDFQGEGSMLESIFEVFIEFLEEGNPLDTVQDLVGISNITFHKWMKRGEHYEENVLEGTHDPMDETCYKFIREVRKAIAMSKRMHVLRLNAVGDLYDWRQSLAILERRDRQNWGKEIVNINKEQIYDPDESFL